MPRARQVPVHPTNCLRCQAAIVGEEDIRQDRRLGAAWVHSRCLSANIIRNLGSGSLSARSPTWCQICGRSILMGSKIAKSGTQDAWAHHHCAAKPLFQGPTAMLASSSALTSSVTKLPSNGDDASCSVCKFATTAKVCSAKTTRRPAGPQESGDNGADGMLPGIKNHHPACEVGKRADKISCAVAMLLSGITT